MVVGIGIDVCSIPRMEGSLERFGERFWKRVLTPGEQEDLAQRPDRATALAGRFAAKEAASKALGAPRDVWWQHVEVRSRAGGKPELVFHGPALPHVARAGVSSSWVSISHDAGVAVAVVVLEARE